MKYVIIDYRRFYI